jgi:hypothetical protein
MPLRVRESRRGLGPMGGCNSSSTALRMTSTSPPARIVSSSPSRQTRPGHAVRPQARTWRFRPKIAPWLWQWPIRDTVALFHPLNIGTPEIWTADVGLRCTAARVVAPGNGVRGRLSSLGSRPSRGRVTEETVMAATSTLVRYEDPLDVRLSATGEADRLSTADYWTPVLRVHH